MIYSLRGTLVHRDLEGVAVECGGVAYYARTSLSTLSTLGTDGKSEVLLYTYMSVKNEALDLFGFADQGELSCFKMLVGVSGVGPKAALSILSSMTPERFALCVASGDYKAITAAPGVGPKLAQRIVLELKDKVGSTEIASGFSAPAAAPMGGTGNVGEAMSALMVLGYSQSEAAAVINALDATLPVEELIKLALMGLAKRG